MSNSKGLPLDQDLPPRFLEKLKKSSEEYTQRVNAERAALGPYPDPESVTEFDDDVDIAELGNNASLLRKAKKRRAQRKKSGARGSGGNKRPLPNPAHIHAEVAKMLAPLPFAGYTGNVQVGEFNAEFLDASKARYFQDAYIEIVSRFHVLLLEEVDCGGVTYLAKVSGYQPYCSTANTRNQAVGFLVHPRMKVLKVTQYDSIARVQGVPDLRPALRLDMEDTVTGETLDVVVLHLKSMRGGPNVTAVVRYKQFAQLVIELGDEFAGLVGGDLNYRINDPTCKDADPMVTAGFQLVAPNDMSATQIMGSRIDGFFQRGMKSDVDFYRVYAYFLVPTVKRSFSDHATLKLEVLVASQTSNEVVGNTGAVDGDDDTVGGAQLPLLARRQPNRNKQSKTKNNKHH